MFICLSEISKLYTIYPLNPMELLKDMENKNLFTIRCKLVVQFMHNLVSILFVDYLHLSNLYSDMQNIFIRFIIFLAKLAKFCRLVH